MKKITQLLKIVPLALCVYASSAQALVINFLPTPGMSAQSLAGFQAAANRWQSVLRDDVTVNLSINFSTLGAGILGSTGSTRGTLSYDGYREALADDAWGATDAQAVAGLTSASCLKVFMNGTSSNPSGVGSANTFLDNDCDANNRTIRMTWANARALGLTAAHDSTIDGSVQFSDAFTWDFDPSDGIAANAFDFIGVATHEIGHALGFVSGVDTMDANRPSAITDSAFTYIAPADLFRCSQQSRTGGADLDWAADNRNKFFSLDNCATTIAQFSTGRTWGDGQQASHWKDNLHIGIMDPTAGKGELMGITDFDLQLYDAIGWDVVPEPASIALFALGLFGLAGVRRRVK